MQTLTVSLAERSYPIHIGPGLLERGDLIAPHFKQKKALVVTNTTVAPLYLERLAATLAAIGIHDAKLRKRAVAIGEKIGLYKDWPVSKGCIIPYVPVWVDAMVKRKT